MKGLMGKTRASPPPPTTHSAWDGSWQKCRHWCTLLEGPEQGPAKERIPDTEWGNLSWIARVPAL